MSTAILVDSAAALPHEILERSAIGVVPMTVVVGGTSRPDTELDTDELLARLAGEGVTTSAPSAGEWMSAMERALRSSDHVVVLTVSAEMSSAFDAAVLGASMVGERVLVVDTRSAAGGEGLVALAAAKLAAQGATASEIVTALRRVIGRVHLVATLDRLDHLARSGRVPVVAGVAAQTLRVNPIFEFRNGAARALPPALGHRAAERRIVHRCIASRPADAEVATLHAAVLDAACPDRARSLLSELRREVPDADVFVAPFGAVMLAHVGPGLVGLAWWWET